MDGLLILNVLWFPSSPVDFAPKGVLRGSLHHPSVVEALLDAKADLFCKSEVRIEIEFGDDGMHAPGWDG